MSCAAEADASPAVLVTPNSPHTCSKQGPASTPRLRTRQRPPPFPRPLPFPTTHHPPPRSPAHVLYMSALEAGAACVTAAWVGPQRQDAVAAALGWMDALRVGESPPGQALMFARAAAACMELGRVGAGPSPGPSGASQAAPEEPAADAAAGLATMVVTTLADCVTTLRAGSLWVSAAHAPSPRRGWRRGGGRSGQRGDCPTGAGSRGMPRCPRGPGFFPGIPVLPGTPGASELRLHACLHEDGVSSPAASFGREDRGRWPSRGCRRATPTASITRACRAWRA